jgi:hypothetical protein
MYILEELKKVLRLSNGGWNINSQKSVLTFGGSIHVYQHPYCIYWYSTLQS